jgi:hypothetical protein
VLGFGASDNVGMGFHFPMMHYASQDSKCLLHHSARYSYLMSDAANRLKQARIAAGHESAKSAAEVMGGVAVSTYIQHENGHRGFRAASAKRYARFFGVNAAWLLYGTGQREDTSVDPNVRQIQQMLESAIQQIPAGVTIGDWPRLVAPALSDQLEQYRAHGGLQDHAGEAPSPDRHAPLHAPTSRDERAARRNP